MSAPVRDGLINQIGAAVVRFQDGATDFDGLAARILALHREDLPCMTMLLFGGPATLDGLTTVLYQRRTVVLATIDRLQLAGYARRQPRNGEVCIELTEHARQWIARIWEPLRQDGGRLLGRYATRDLAAMSRLMDGVCELQTRHVLRLRHWLALPASGARKAHLRGGLSPAALQRVQLFVEANLGQPIRLGDLADRAALSVYHFARAFKTTAGMTPRAFIEERRIARAGQLIRHSNRSLAAIAVESGFGTQSRLTTVFKRHTGFTPAEYRRGRPSPVPARRPRFS